MGGSIVPSRRPHSKCYDAGDDRPLADPDKAYVEYFQDYVDDLDTFERTIVERDTSAARLLLAHSTGSTIALLHADQHPGVFSAIAASAPMIEIDTGAFPPAIAG